MLEKNERMPERSELLERVSKLSSEFENRFKAIDSYLKELTELSLSHGKSVDEYLAIAETQPVYSEDLMRALSLARIIKSLKSIG